MPMRTVDERCEPITLSFSAKWAFYHEASSPDLDDYSCYTLTYLTVTRFALTGNSAAKNVTSQTRSLARPSPFIQIAFLKLCGHGGSSPRPVCLLCHVHGEGA
jgi:hypothetical protein